MGGKCCKCNGGRGAWLTKCYDNPIYCCGVSESRRNNYFKKQEVLIIRSKERRKHNFTNKTRRRIKKLSKKIRNISKKFSKLWH